MTINSMYLSDLSGGPYDKQIQIEIHNVKCAASADAYIWTKINGQDGKKNSEKLIISIILFFSLIQFPSQTCECHDEI